jgi:hypothetical protein
MFKEAGRVYKKKYRVVNVVLNDTGGELGRIARSEPPILFQSAEDDEVRVLAERASNRRPGDVDSREKTHWRLDTDRHHVNPLEQPISVCNHTVIARRRLVGIMMRTSNMTRSHLSAIALTTFLPVRLFGELSANRKQR